MSNKEIFSRTFGFSVRRFLFTVLAFIAAAALCLVGYAIGEHFLQKGLLGLGIGAVVALVFLIIFLRYVAYTYKAGQIAMMTQGVTAGELPDDVIGAGKQVVKSRFKTVAIYFAATGIIRGIFAQIGKGITKLGDRLGGDTGRTVGSAVSTVISVIVSYLCDCCLGWVFYRDDIGAGRATCEGAVLFFKHGKTFARNMGRIFGIGLLTLVIIGGIFGGIAYFAGQPLEPFFAEFAVKMQEIAAEGERSIPQFLQTAQGLMIAASAVVGLIFWSIIHGSFIRPFVLTGVLRNYMEAGMDDIPTEDSFRMLDSRSAKFRKLHEELA